jgi:hypothetical protein
MIEGQERILTIIGEKRKRSYDTKLTPYFYLL